MQLLRNLFKNSLSGGTGNCSISVCLNCDISSLLQGPYDHNERKVNFIILAYVKCGFGDLGSWSHFKE